MFVYGMLVSWIVVAQLSIIDVRNPKIQVKYDILIARDHFNFFKLC